MGHPEVAETPGQCGDNRDKAEAADGPVEDVARTEETQIAGDRLCVLDNGAPAAGRADAEEQHDDQREGHHETLDQAGDRGGHEAAGRRVRDDDKGTQQHRGQVADAEHAVKQLAAGHKGRGGIGYEEHHHDERAERLDQVGIIVKAAGEEVRHRDGADCRRIAAQAAGNDQPVEPGAERESDGRPSGLGHAAEEGQPRYAHQQIGAHVRGLGAHGRHDRAELPAAQIEVVRAVVALGVMRADGQHTDQIHGDRGDNTYG